MLKFHDLKALTVVETLVFLVILAAIVAGASERTAAKRHVLFPVESAILVAPPIVQGAALPA